MKFKESTKELIRQFPCKNCLVGMTCRYSTNMLYKREACDRFAKYIAIAYYAYLYVRPIYKQYLNEHLPKYVKHMFRHRPITSSYNIVKLGSPTCSRSEYEYDLELPILVMKYEVSPIMKNSKHIIITTNSRYDREKTILNITDVKRQLMELQNDH